MVSSKQQLGQWGESLAAAYFQQKGYRILTRNFRIRGGELDLVVNHATELLFVEVKTRTNARFQHPLESITPTKMRRMKKAAMAYCERYLSTEIQTIRFDLITILGTPETDYSLQHYPDIFDFLFIEPEI